jgi:hypothetical protein
MTAIGIRHVLRYDLLEALTGMQHRALAPPEHRGRHCTGVDQTVQSSRHGVGRTTLLRAAKSRRQETVRLEGKACRGCNQSNAIGQPVRKVMPYPWPARHPAELALLAKSEPSNRRQDGACAGAVDRVVAGASGARGADLRRR